jgi:hypothetical protein
MKVELKRDGVWNRTKTYPTKEMLAELMDRQLTETMKADLKYALQEGIPYEDFCEEYGYYLEKEDS